MQAFEIHCNVRAFFLQSIAVQNSPLKFIVNGMRAKGEFRISDQSIGFFYIITREAFESSPMKKNDTPSSKSVAAALGVSVSTISRVLTRPELVNERTRERVLRGIERLGYRPNLAARDLRRGQTGIVLVMAPLLGSFFLDIVHGVEKAADDRGFSVLLANTWAQLSRESTYYELAASHRADGVILITTSAPPQPGKSSVRLPPLVLAAEPLPNCDLPAITIDHTAGAEEAVRHLINLGHRRIAHIAGPDMVPSSLARLAGYRRALRAARLALDDTLIQGGMFSIESGSMAMHALLQQRRIPTAVFCANDLMAVGAIRALKSVGLRVPADVSIVGFDDDEVAQICDPPLTTMHIPRFDVGYQAMMALADFIAQSRRPSSMILPTRLIVRSSSAVPPKRR
jgi:LacI family repressor for deo operon, udp, cdd, tsx, nupC, and nupG